MCSQGPFMSLLRTKKLHPQVASTVRSSLSVVSVGSKVVSPSLTVPVRTVRPSGW